MSIFDFKRKQRLSTELTGHTSGQQIFQVGEYNQAKKITYSLSAIVFLVFTIFYFYWIDIPTKIRGFMGIITLGCFIFGYFKVRQMKILRQRLY